jgi:hypothetical protein
MSFRKKYNPPKIDPIEIDVSISLQSESGPPGGGGPFDVQATTDSEKESSFKETDDSGISENPFER